MEKPSPLPRVISKAFLEQFFNRKFRWLRKHLLTDEVVVHELEFDLKEFKSWIDIPPIESKRLKNWLTEKELI